MCLCAHEAGHVLAAVATGGTVTDIALLNSRPHVRIAGAASATGEAVRAVGGSVWFLLLYAVAAVRWRRPRGDWQVVKYAMSLFAAVEILGWSISCLAPPSIMGPNDAADFLAVSHVNPYLVAAVAGGIGVCGRLALGALDSRPMAEPRMENVGEKVRALARGAAGGS